MMTSNKLLIKLYNPLVNLSLASPGQCSGWHLGASEIIAGEGPIFENVMFFSITNV